MRQDSGRIIHGRGFTGMQPQEGIVFGSTT